MKSKSLEKLIHSLEKGERRYCRQHLSREKGAAAAIRLKIYDAIINGNVAMKDAKDRRFSQSTFASHRKRLFNTLLEHIRILHSRRTKDTDLWSLYHESNLLFSLGLVEEALEKVKKALRQAEYLEELMVELAIRELLREILKNLSDKTTLEEIKDNEYKLETLSEKLMVQVKYTILNDRIFALTQAYRHSSSSTIKNGLNELMQSPLLTNIHNASSIPAQLRYYHCLATYAGANNRVEESIDHYLRILALWESKPERIALYPHMYMGVLNNVVGKLNILQRLEESLEYIRKLEETPTRNIRESVLKFVYTENHYQLYYLNNGMIRQLLVREPTMTSGLSTFQNLVPESFRITFRYNMAIAYLMNGDFGSSLRYFTSLRDLGRLSTRHDLQGMARVFRLLLLSENDDLGSFFHYLRNTKRYFDRTHVSYELEQFVISWLKTHYKIQGSSERKDSFGNLENAMKSLTNRRLLGAEEIGLWARSHAIGIPIKTLYKNIIAKNRCA